MADNITAPATGAVLATDEIGGIHYPRTKLAHGANGVATDVSTASPLPVEIISGGGGGAGDASAANQDEQTALLTTINAALASPVTVDGTVELGATTLTALETTELGAATLAALESVNATITGTVEIGAASLAALETTELGATSLAALENITIGGTVDLGSTSLAALETVTVALDAPSLAALETIDLGSTSLAALESVTVGGTVELGATSLAALESITATGPLTDTQLRATAVPTSLAALPALVAGAAIIGRVGIDQTTDGTTNKVNIDASLKSGSATRASVNSGTSSVSILASNANRKGATILNSDANALLLDLSGGTAAATRYQVRLAQYQSYEVGSGYTGAITGIWEADGTGVADVVEFT